MQTTKTPIPAKALERQYKVHHKNWVNSSDDWHLRDRQKVADQLKRIGYTDAQIEELELQTI